MAGELDPRAAGGRRLLAVRPRPVSSAYATSKRGIMALTKHPRRF
jgi:hypothetical protein